MEFHIRCITSKTNTCFFPKFEYNNNCSEGNKREREGHPTNQKGIENEENVL